jgi:hypothetical protein
LNGRLKPLLAGALLFFIAFAVVPAIISIPAAAVIGTPTAATSLAVAVDPVRLPADGQSFQAVIVSLIDASANPSLALTPTTVYLTSSEENVGTVPNSVVIPAGKGYAIANFTTTSNPGVTSITASAPGFTSAQTVLDTIVPSGFATHLKVTASPTSVLASGTGSLVIQLQDATNSPAKATSALNVTVTSSEDAIVQPDQGFVIIPAGADIAILNFSTGYQLGTTVLTASVSTLLAGQTTIQVVGPNPFALSVSTQPNQVVEGGSGSVVVWITGSVGHPAQAPEDIAVTLTSSNTTVAQVTRTVIIHRGQMSATAVFTAGSKSGTTAITASAQGLQSGFASVQSFKALLKPAGLKLFFAPDPVIANDAVYQSVTVAIVNSTGYPDVATSQVVVNLTSASTNLGTVPNSVTILSGQESAVASFSSTYLVGTTILTASAQNLVTAQVAATTYGPIPIGIVVSPTSGTLPANGGKYDALQVGLVDASGSPAIAPSNIIVRLTSSLPSVVAVNPILQFEAGQSSIVTSVQTGISSGVANITASSAGYQASFALVTAVIPAPTNLGLFVQPATAINETAGSESILTVQLQDVNGLPAQASQFTSVTITSSNTAVVKAPIVLTIAPGADFASTVVTTLGSGKTNLTATAAGLKSSSATLSVLTSPVTIAASTPAPIVAFGTTATITVTVTALGQGLPNATVQWLTTSGTLQPTSGNTSAQGTASTVLIAKVPGTVTVTAEVTSPFFGTVNATAAVYFTPPPVVTQPSLSDRLHPYLIVIVVVILVVVGAVVFIFLRRRRRKKALAEGETPAEEQPYDELEEGPAPDEGAEDGVMLFRGSAPWRLAGGMA